MRSKTAYLMLASATAWLLWTGLSATRLAAQDNLEAEYKEKISEAVREFDLGNWQEARALFSSAHQIKPNARTLRGMGKAAFEMRKYVWALRDLEAAMRDTRQALSPEQRDEVQKLIDQCKAFTGRFHLSVEPANATVEVDGKPAELTEDNALLLEIGEHKIVARAPDYQELEKALTVQGNEDQNLSLMLEPVVTAPPTPAPAPVAQPVVQNPPPPVQKPASAPPPPKKASKGPAWAWATLAIGALTGLAAGGFRVISDKEFDSLKKDCETGCQQDDYDKRKKGIQTFDKMTTGLLIGSISFGVLTIVLFIVESSGGGEEKATDKSSGAKAALGIGPNKSISGEVLDYVDPKITSHLIVSLRCASRNGFEQYRL